MDGILYLTATYGGHGGIDVIYSRICENITLHTLKKYAH